jgi:hypothetical protein
LGNEEFQRDPKEMIDAMVSIVPADAGLFRNVLPKADQEFVKTNQNEAWKSVCDSEGVRQIIRFPLHSDTVARAHVGEREVGFNFDTARSSLQRLDVSGDRDGLNGFGSRDNDLSRKC